MLNVLLRILAFVSLGAALVSCSLIVDIGDLAHPDADDDGHATDGDGGTEADVQPDAVDGDGNADADGDVDGDVDVDAGADRDVDADADVRPDGSEGDADADRGGDADTDGDVDEDREADGDDGSSTCSGGWFDPSSGLCWQDPPEGTIRSWADAVAYCEGLSLGGYGPGSWHLPTISELRSLIRGCPGTETGGPCGVTDTCLDLACLNASCDAHDCSGGPGAGDAYWPPGLGGTANWCWSSSSCPDCDPDYAWHVNFGGGNVSAYSKGGGDYVRCVRPGA